MTWDPTIPATNAALLSAPVRENFAALDALMGADGAVWPLLAPDGTVTAPSYAWATESGLGLYRSGTGAMSLGVSYTAPVMTLGTINAIGPFYGLSLANYGLVGWSATESSALAPDTILARDSAGVLAQRNGAGNAQKFRVYKTYDVGAAEWLEMDWATTADVALLRTWATGTGTARELRLLNGGTASMAIRIMPTSLNGGVQLAPSGTNTTALNQGRVSVGQSAFTTATSGASLSLRLQETFAPTATSSMIARPLEIASAINYSAATPGAGYYEAIKISITETALPTGLSFMIRCAGGAAGATDVFGVTRDGAIKLGIPAVPATPPAGYGMLYMKADKKLYFKDDAGLESALF